MSFGREFLKAHETSLEIILIHYFMDEEIVIFEKICNITQKILLSITAIYPLDLSCWNKSQMEQEEFAVFFYKHIGETKSQTFQVDWHESTIEERKIAENWVKRTIPIIIQQFEQNYFSQESFTVYDYDKSFGKIVDQINLQVKEPSQSLRNEVWRLFIIMDQILGGSICGAHKAVMKACLRIKSICFSKRASCLKSITNSMNRFLSSAENASLIFWIADLLMIIRSCISI